MEALFQRSQRFVVWLGILPLLLAFVSYRTSAEHIASVQATLATDAFIRRLDELLSTLQDAETGQRGYLLTGQQRYLDPFLDAQADLPLRLAQMEVLAKRNGVPHKEIVELRHLVDLKTAELQTAIEQRRTQGLNAALAEVATNRGEQYMSDIRSLIGRWEDEQVGKFEQRWEQQHRRENQLKAVLVVGVISGTLLLVLAYRFNWLYARERDQIEQQIRRLNNSLESRVSERTAELEERTRELEQRRAELQKSNADLTHFAYIASHDLQEPLRMVGSYMGLLARRYRGQLDETADRYIEFAIDGAHRMQALIQDLLVYSRAGTQALEKNPVSLLRVVETALKNLEVAIRESDAVITAEDLPVVQADETKLTQVMQNLIGNAIKFRKLDTRPEVVIHAKPAENVWLISVADNGIGFEAKYSDRIFQVFQRLHGVGRYPGNGIGLAICRRIIEHHGGQLWADSEPQVGSTFFFSLPIVTGAAVFPSNLRDEQLRGTAQSVTQG